MAGELWGKVDRSFGLHDSVDVAAQGGAIVGRGGGVEGAERVHRLRGARQQRNVLVGLRGDRGEAVEAPLITVDADFEKLAHRSDVFALGIDGLEVKDALFGRTIRVGTEDHLPGPSLGSGEWVRGEEEGVVLTVEVDALGREGGVALNRGVQRLHLGLTVEMPSLSVRSRGE